MDFDLEPVAFDVAARTGAVKRFAVCVEPKCKRVFVL
jgi:hypothetical protein